MNRPPRTFPTHAQENHAVAIHELRQHALHTLRVLEKFPNGTITETEARELAEAALRVVGEK